MRSIARHAPRPVETIGKRPLRLFHVLVFLAAAACTSAPERVARDVTQAEPLGRLEAVNMLKARRFEELTARIVALQREFEAGQRTDFHVNEAFGAFDHADPALEKLLDEWVALENQPHIPLLARGVFFSRLGWLARGSKKSNQTAQRQFAEMNRYFAAAQRDTHAALALNPRLSRGYSVLIGIYAAKRGHAAARKVFDTAEATLKGAAFHIWKFAHFSGRNWTGTSKTLEFLLRRAEKAEGDDPYTILAGYRDYRAAQQHYRTGNYAAAAPLFDRAVAAKPKNPAYANARAWNYWQLDRNDDALAEARRAVKIYPEAAGNLSLMARIHWQRNELDIAMGYIDKAVALQPYDPTYLMVRAELYAITKQWDKGLADLDRALVFGDYRAKLHAARAWHFERADRAAKTGTNTAKMKFEWRRATELDPDNDKYWDRYLSVMAFARDCATGSAAITYLRQCLARGTCGRKDILGLSGMVNGISDKAQCPYERNFVAKQFSDALTEADRRMLHKHDERGENYARDRVPGRSDVRGFTLAGLKLGATIDQVRAVHPNLKIRRQFVPNTDVMVMAVARGRTRDGSAELTVAFSHDGKAHTVYTLRTVEIAASPRQVEAMLAARRAAMLVPYGKPDRVITNRANGKRSYEFRQTDTKHRRVAALVLEQDVPVVRGKNKGKAVYAVKIGLGMVDDSLIAETGDEVRRLAMRYQAQQQRR